MKRKKKKVHQSIADLKKALRQIAKYRESDDLTDYQLQRESDLISQVHDEVYDLVQLMSHSGMLQVFVLDMMMGPKRMVTFDSDDVRIFQNGYATQITLYPPVGAYIEDAE